MKTASLALVIPLSAVLAGAVSGLVQHALAPGGDSTGGAVLPSAAPEQPSLAPLVERMNRLIDQLQMEPPRAARASSARQAVGPPDLTPLEDLIARIEDVQRQLTERVMTEATRTVEMPSRPGGVREKDWTSLEPLFAGEEDLAEARIRERYLFMPLARILEEFGRPDHCYRSETGTLRLRYERKWDGGAERLDLYFSDGYVHQVGVNKRTY